MRAILKSADGLSGVRKVAYPPEKKILTYVYPAVNYLRYYQPIDPTQEYDLRPGRLVDTYFDTVIYTRRYELYAFIDAGNEAESLAEYREVV